MSTSFKISHMLPPEQFATHLRGFRKAVNGIRRITQRYLSKSSM